MQALRIEMRGGRLRLTPPAPLPLDRMLLGRPVAEVAALLPRLFNLCPVAQGVAARLALGLPDHAGPDALAQEILRDHLRRLFHLLPPLMGLPVRGMPSGDIAPALFGPRRGLPDRYDDLIPWAAAGEGCAPLVAAVIGEFAPHQAVADRLPLARGNNLLAGHPVENCAAARRATHPLLRAVEARAGRGPLWRLLGMLADAGASVAGELPPARLEGDVALVPASRGSYALRLGQSAGRVTAITRVTPTDHQCAPGGALDTALARLPRPDLAPLLIALHDPCVPVLQMPEAALA